MRQKLAALPIAEKLRMLDAMREREVAIRPRGSSATQLQSADDEACNAPTDNVPLT